MPDFVGGPILGHAAVEGVVERAGGRPHIVGAGGVVGRHLQRGGGQVYQCHQNGFRLPVLHHGADGVGEVLFSHVHEGIHQAVANLFLGQGISRLGVQNRKAREDQVAAEREFFLDTAAGNNGAVVHFAAGGGEGEHAAKRQGFFDLGEAVARQNIPRVAAGVEGCRRDELDAVDDRAAANRQQKVRALLLNFLHSLHKRVVIGVGFNPAKFQRLALLERRHHLLIDAVLLDRAPAVKDHHFGFAGDELVNFRDGAGSKNDAGGVVECEVVNHETFSCAGYLTRRCGRGALRWIISQCGQFGAGLSWV